MAMGGFSVANPTLNRFYSLHFLLPFIIVAIVILHLWSLHTHGSNNPKGVKLKQKDMIPFHPYYTVKDFVGFGIYLFIFAYFIFYKPDLLGHLDNYIPANPLVTPAHIVPEWYFLPFYAILRAVPSKLGGVVLMLGSILILFFLPWIDKSPVRSANYRLLYKWAFLIFVINCFGYVGGKPAEKQYLTVSRIAASYYFFHFLVLVPLIARIEKPLPLPKVSAKQPLQLVWPFEGIFGTFDRQAAQLGAQVYFEVCSACHSNHNLYYRNLKDIGFSEAEIKQLAQKYTFKDGPNAEGEMFDRPALPSDRFVSPYPNDEAARAANNGGISGRFIPYNKSKA